MWTLTTTMGRQKITKLLPFARRMPSSSNERNFEPYPCLLHSPPSVRPRAARRCKCSEGVGATLFERNAERGGRGGGHTTHGAVAGIRGHHAGRRGVGAAQVAAHRRRRLWHRCRSLSCWHLAQLFALGNYEILCITCIEGKLIF